MSTIETPTQTRDRWEAQAKVSAEAFEAMQQAYDATLEVIHLLGQRMTLADSEDVTYVREAVNAAFEMNRLADKVFGTVWTVEENDRTNVGEGAT